MVIWDLGSIWEAHDFSLCSAAGQLGESESVSCSVMFDSGTTRDCRPARLLCPWNSPGKTTGVGSHALLLGSLESKYICRDLLSLFSMMEEAEVGHSCRTGTTTPYMTQLHTSGCGFIHRLKFTFQSHQKTKRGKSHIPSRDLVSNQ